MHVLRAHESRGTGLTTNCDATSKRMPGKSGVHYLITAITDTPNIVCTEIAVNDSHSMQCG